MDSYELTGREQAHRDDILGRLEADKDLFLYDRITDEYKTDGEGHRIKLGFEVVLGKRFCVDHHGATWRFAAEGALKELKGAPRRNNAVEMWTGHWRKVNVDGKPGYIKNLVWAPCNLGVNQRPGTTHIDYYRNKKGYKHPLEKPHAPTEDQLSEMGAREVEMRGAIHAKTQELAAEHGIDASKLQEADAPTPSSYAQLQTRAKALGIKANQSKAALIEAIEPAESTAPHPTRTNKTDAA